MDDVASAHPKLAIKLATRFAPITPELLKKHRSKLDKNLLAQNPHVAVASARAAASHDPYPTEDPGLGGAWERFVQTSIDAPGDARMHAFLDASRALLDASYVTGYRMLGRDWETEHQSGWFFVARVRELDWSEAVIASLADRLDFGALSANPGLPWTAALVERFAERWSWESLARNEALPWSEALLDRFASFPLDALSQNARFPWSAALMERYAERVDWRALSRNPGITWTEELATGFAARVSWTALAMNSSCAAREPLLATHAESLDWEALSAHGAFWTAELVERFADRMDFGSKGLSANARMTWTRELLERYKDRLDSRELARNRALWNDVFAPALDTSALERFLATQ